MRFETSHIYAANVSLPKGDLLGRTHLEVYLAKAGLPAAEAFLSSIHNPSKSASVRDIFCNKADVAITTDAAYNLAIELSQNKI